MNYSRKPLDEFLHPFRHDQGVTRILGTDLSLTKIENNQALRVYKINEENAMVVEVDLDMNVKSVMIVSKPISENPKVTLKNMADLEIILMTVISTSVGTTKAQSLAILKSLGLFEVNAATRSHVKTTIDEIDFIKKLGPGTITFSISESDKLHKKLNREAKIKRIFRN